MAAKPMTIGDLYRRMGPAKFFGMWAVLIAWVALGIYLVRWSNVRTICPDSGRGILQFVKTLACSPALLRGGAMEYGVFVWLWSIPAALVALLLWARAYAKKLASNPSSNSEAE
jgi:hypothetical protein